MMSWILLLFLGWTLLSVTWAQDPSAALIQDGGYALGIGLFFIVFTAVHERKQLPLFMGILLAGAVASALYGFVAAAPSGSSTLGADRLSSYLDPNELAAILVPAAALSVGIGALWAKSPGIRLAAYAAGVFCLVATFLTVSRGGLIALAVALFAAVLFGGRWRLRIVVLTVVTALLGVYYIAAIAPPQARDRILQTTQGQQQLMEGRTTIWQIGWRMAQANPVKGVGSGNFPIVSRRYVLQPGEVLRSDLIIDTPKVAHNIYLEILAELGVVGLSLFLVIAFFSVRSALLAARRFNARDDPAAELLSRCLAVAILGMLTASFFISIELDKHLWLLLGLGPVLLNISRHGEREAPHRELQLSG
jgi:O-antigen ligase